MRSAVFALLAFEPFLARVQRPVDFEFADFSGTIVAIGTFEGADIRVYERVDGQVTFLVRTVAAKFASVRFLARMAHFVRLDRVCAC